MNKTFNYDLITSVILSLRYIPNLAHFCADGVNFVLTDIITSLI